MSVGYRVKSHRGTQFRIWSTQRLREYLIKGFTMNDVLLKQAGGGNYFNELLARIRDIRSSENWIERLDAFLKLNEYEILTHPGMISHEAGLKKAHAEYDKYREKSNNELSLVEKHFLNSLDHTMDKLIGES
ncbi:virulence RhuM family protein [Cohnella sp. NL03-T5]|nr:virulence RhuM family protein [Cohnella silvisoli]